MNYPTNLEADLDVLCSRLNVLTSPGDLRTASEHVWCNNEARRVKETIQSRWQDGVHFELAESGRFIPLRDWRTK